MACQRDGERLQVYSSSRFFRAIHDFSQPPRHSGHGARVFRSDRSQRRPPALSEAPHETCESDFVDVSKDTDRRDSARNFERVHLRPVPATLQFTRDLTGS